MLSNSIKGEFSLYTDKEALFYTTLLASLAHGKSVIYNVSATDELVSLSNLIMENTGAEIKIQNEQWEIEGVNFKPRQRNFDWVPHAFPYQKRDLKILEHLLEGLSLHFEETLQQRDSLIRELSEFGIQAEWKFEGLSETDELARRFARLQKVKAEKKWIFDMPVAHTMLARDRLVKGSAVQAAAIVAAVAIIPDSDVVIKNPNLDGGNNVVFSTLKRLGANVDTSRKDITAKASRELVGRKLSAETLSCCLEEIPLLCFLAAFADGETILNLPHYYVEEQKELLQAIYENLKVAGVEVGLYEEGMIIRGKSECDGGDFDCKGFPVLALALHIFSMRAKGKSGILGLECLRDVYPVFLGTEF